LFDLLLYYINIESYHSDTSIFKIKRWCVFISWYWLTQDKPVVTAFDLYQLMSYLQCIVGNSDLYNTTINKCPLYDLNNLCIDGQLLH